MEASRVPLISHSKRKVVRIDGQDSGKLRPVIFFVVVSALCVALIVPGFYLYTNPTPHSVDHGFGLWLCVLAGFNFVSLLLLMTQVCLQTNRSCLLALLPVPLSLMEATWDLVGTALLHYEDRAVEPLWVITLALVLISCLKVWVHCWFSSILAVNGWEYLGLKLCSQFWGGENQYGKCRICGERIEPGCEIERFNCEQNHICHLLCKTTVSGGICPICRLEA